MTTPLASRALRRLALLAGLTALALASASAALAADPKVLNVYNWSDYIADDTIRNFEKETGIKVNYDNYDSNEVLLAKLVAGNTGYDVVVPGAHFAKTEIEGGLLQKLDRSRLTNWGNLDPALLKQLAAVDPGNQYLVDWLWGYVTVGINVPKVKAALALEQAGREQLDLDAVLAWPAGRPVDLAQAPPVDDAEGGHRAVQRGNVEHREGRPLFRRQR